MTRTTALSALDQHFANLKAIPQRTYGHDHGYANGNGDVCANPKADANRDGSLRPKEMNNVNADGSRFVERTSGLRDVELGGSYQIFRIQVHGTDCY
jgi:hypothetical protein